MTEKLTPKANEILDELIKICPWEEVVDIMAIVGQWDDQVENLRNAGHLGATDGENTTFRKDLS